MSNLRDTLRDLADRLSEGNYEEHFARYRFWLDLGCARRSITVQDQVDGDVWRVIRWDSLKDTLTNPTTPLFIRFIGDIEADRKIAGHALGLHRQHCESTLDRFFEDNLCYVNSSGGNRASFLTRVNLIAHWANLGYVKEAAIRNHILQSLISHSKLYDRQAEALIILFKLAGATFEACVDPSVVDRCFELLKGHYSSGSVKWRLVQVRALRAVKGDHWVKTNLFSGGSQVAGEWMGGSPSPACIKPRTD